MLYTRFFARINKEQGLRNIGHYQMGRIMNIVFLEGQLKGFIASEAKDKKGEQHRNIQLKKFSIQKRLTQLTGNKQPNALMQEICYLSEKEI